MRNKAGGPEGAGATRVLLPPLAVLQGWTGLALQAGREWLRPTVKGSPSPESGRVHQMPSPKRKGSAELQKPFVYLGN